MKVCELKGYKVDRCEFVNKINGAQKIELTHKYSYNVGYAANNTCKGEFTAEVMDKEEVKAELDNEIADTGEKIRKVRQKFEAAQADLKTVKTFTAEHIRDPEEWLPEPGAFESAKAYRKKILPIFTKIVKLVQPLYTALVDLKRKYRQVSDRNRDLEGRIDRLHVEISEQKAELKMLRDEAENMEYLKKSLGAPAVEKMVIDARSRIWAEVPNQKQTRTPMMDR